MAKHPADMAEKPLTLQQQQIVRAAGHFYAGTKGQGRKILLGDPGTYGPGYVNEWTKPTYYVHGYRIRYKVLGGDVVTLRIRTFDPNTGTQIGPDKDYEMLDNASKVVDRPPGTYVSVFNPYPTTQSVEGDKDFGGGDT